MSGYESQEYMDEPNNHAIYDVNTAANYDPEIITSPNASIGSASASAKEMTQVY